MIYKSNSKSYFMIGCMSGTSLDGIDLAYVKFTKNNDWKFQILSSETVNYDLNWKKKLSEAINLTPYDLKKLDIEYTNFLGTIIKDFIDKKKIEILDAVASHGHTIFHQPEKHLTFQIGNLSDLSYQIGFPVVCDFRTQDVALGGQGAPLVPIGDMMLFGKNSACLNLGGFSNISLFKNGKVLAYDICAVNTVLNPLSNRMDLPYDDLGRVAQRGKEIPLCLKELDKIEFYTQTPPKSLGIEWVQKNVTEIIDKYNKHKTEDLLHTYTLHISTQIAKKLPEEGTVLLSGGGAYNTFLVNEIQKKSNVKIIVPSEKIIDFKEALIFAFLGLLKLHGSINCLASVTGAIRDHSSGKIFKPKSKIK